MKDVRRNNETTMHAKRGVVSMSMTTLSTHTSAGQPSKKKNGRIRGFNNNESRFQSKQPNYIHSFSIKVMLVSGQTIVAMAYRFLSSDRIVKDHTHDLRVCAVILNEHDNSLISNYTANARSRFAW